MSVQDVIKKSVLESSVFDKFDVPGMLTAHCHSAAPWRSNLLGLSKILRRSDFFQKLCIHTCRNDGSYMYGHTGNQYEYCDFPWYGWCIIYCTFSYSSQRSDGSSLSVLGDNDRNYSRCRYVCACGTGGSDHDCYDLFVLSQTAEWEDLYCSIHYTGDDAGDEIIRNFGKIRYFIKSKTMRKEKTEMAVEVFCRQNQMDFTEKIRKIENVDDVTLIQYNGEYHG